MESLSLLSCHCCINSALGIAVGRSLCMCINWGVCVCVCLFSNQFSSGPGSLWKSYLCFRIISTLDILMAECLSISYFVSASIQPWTCCMAENVCISVSFCINLGHAAWLKNSISDHFSSSHTLWLKIFFCISSALNILLG